MNMQTGPAQGQRMDSWLIWTGGVEIANIAVFSILALLIVAGRPGHWYLTLIGVLTLDLLLFEGGLYWLGKHWRIGHRPGDPLFRFRFLQLLYAGNVVLLLVFPIVVVINQFGQVSTGPFDFLLGLAYYLFALGEFFHYFLFKLNMRASERHRVLKTGRLVRARFLRELTRTRTIASNQK